jgi:hypothetical protein
LYHYGRFVEFPSPGDLKKHLLPVFHDPEEINIKSPAGVEHLKKNVQQTDEYWMPVSLVDALMVVVVLLVVFTDWLACLLTSTL